MFQTPPSAEVFGEGIVGIAVLVGIAIFIFGLSLFEKGKRGRRRQWRPRVLTRRPDMADPANQMNAISNARFVPVRVLNASEYRVFAALEDIVADLAPGHRVLAQVSLGEVIKVPTSAGDWRGGKDAFASVNSKRIDIAVMDPRGFVVLAVEYQGQGHHQGNAFIRDAVKREALRKAGIPMLEVVPGMTPSELRLRASGLLQPAHSSVASIS